MKSNKVLHFIVQFTICIILNYIFYYFFFFSCNLQNVCGTPYKVYFCDKAKPTQKPIFERINRDFRHWFPKGIDLDVYSQEYYDKIVNIINERPRQCLGWNSAKNYFVNFIKKYVNIKI